MIEQFLRAFAMTYAKAATQRKGQCQCLLYPNMSLKKTNIAILNQNYLKTYRTPLRKFQALEEIVSPMKLVMWFTKLKRLHKRVMNRHQFFSGLGNCVDRTICKCSDDFYLSVILHSHFWSASEICAGLWHTCQSFEIGSQSSEELRTKRACPEKESNYL